MNRPESRASGLLPVLRPLLFRLNAAVELESASVLANWATSTIVYSPKTEADSVLHAQCRSCSIALRFVNPVSAIAASKPHWEEVMIVHRTIGLSLVIVLVLCFATGAQPQQQAGPAQTQDPSKPRTSEPAAERPGQEPEREGPAGAEPKAPPEKKTPGREPVKVVDIAPETATHLECEPLKVEFKRLTALRIRDDNCLLASDGDAKAIKIISPAGEQVGVIELPFAPEALDIAADGTLYCGGDGQLAKLDADGHVLKMERVPDDVAPRAADHQASEPPQPASEENQPPEKTELAPKVEGAADQAEPTPIAADQGEPTQVAAEPAEDRKPAPPRRRRTQRPQHVSGIAVTDRDVFVAFGSGWSLKSQSKLYRFDLGLENPQALAEGLRGCCQRCDIKSRDGVLYLAENSAHRVVRYDRDGAVLSKWGEHGRDDLKTFGACCNPMNVCFDGQGVLYTAESGLGRVKRYTTDGEFLDLVGYVGTERFWAGSGLAASCSNMAIAATSDGRRVYVMDYQNNRIRVLDKKVAADEVETR
jgi:hypothetical protein